MKRILTLLLTVIAALSVLTVAVLGIYGDLSSDDKVNARDAVRLAQYLAGWDIGLSEQEKENADVYYDGVINAKDAVKLAQYLADWDVYLGPKDDGDDGDDVLWGDNEEDISDIFDKIEVPEEPTIPTTGISFDDVSFAYMPMTDLTQMPNTIEAWVNIEATDEMTSVFGNYRANKKNSFMFRVTKRVPVIKFGNISAGVSFKKSALTVGEWTHLTITVDVENREFRCYINGVLSETVAMTDEYLEAVNTIEFSSSAGTLTSTLGSTYHFADGINYPFMGQMASFSAYSDVRSASEVAADHKMYGNPDQSNLMVSYVFEESKKAVYYDLSKNENNLSWGGFSLQNGDELELPEDYDFSMMVIGDTQGLTVRQKDASGYYNMYNWIEENIESRKIQAVIGVGDITDDNTDGEWEKAQKVFAQLDGKVLNFPVLGNHDISTDYVGTDPELYKQYIKFVEDGNNGSYDGTISNYYYRFEIQGNKYLFLGLGYMPTQETVDWAKTVLDAHLDYNVIISCHGYLDNDGTVLNKAGVPLLREQLILPYSNIVLVLCGHMHNDNVLLNTETRADGTIVQALLTNPHDFNCTINAGVATGLYFTNGGKTVYVANHIAGYDAYLGADSVRSFELDLIHNRK